MASRTVRAVVGGAVGVVVVAILAGGGGGGEPRVALAVQRAERAGDVVLLTVECADDLEVDQQPDPAGSGLPQITVWGSPKMGRCVPPVAVDALAGDEFVDGASSQVVIVGR